MNRPDIPEIRPARHARPSLSLHIRQALASAWAAVAVPARSWSPGVVAAGALMLLASVVEEIAEAVGAELSPTVHLVLAGLSFGGVAIYLLHKGTSDLK